MKSDKRRSEVFRNKHWCKFRFVEKDDGKFYIQQGFLFIWWNVTSKRAQKTYIGYGMNSIKMISVPVTADTWDEVLHAMRIITGKE
jgi:hypothetical protein